MRSFLEAYFDVGFRALPSERNVKLVTRFMFEFMRSKWALIAVCCCRILPRPKTIVFIQNPLQVTSFNHFELWFFLKVFQLNYLWKNMKREVKRLQVFALAALKIGHVRNGGPVLTRV